MENNETTIYLLKFALNLLESKDLEHERDENNWIIGRDIEAHIKELEQVKKLNIHDVSNQRELLINYNNWLDENVSLRYNRLKTEHIDEFLKSN